MSFVAGVCFRCSFPNSNVSKILFRERDVEMRCDVFAVMCCIWTFQLDTFDFLELVLPYTLLFMTTNASQLPQNLFCAVLVFLFLQIEPWMDVLEPIAWFGWMPWGQLLGLDGRYGANCLVWINVVGPTL